MTTVGDDQAPGPCLLVDDRAARLVGGRLAGPAPADRRRRPGALGRRGRLGRSRLPASCRGGLDGSSAAAYLGSGPGDVGVR